MERFIFVSTDKAINPSSVMGCSKRLAEKALQARQTSPGNQTVVPGRAFWKRSRVERQRDTYVPAADRARRACHRHPPEMVRYFMTITESVGLVLQTATLGHGGEIFILDMGQPVKIIDLARQMIELSGLQA